MELRLPEKVAVYMLKKQMRTDDKGWYSMFDVW
jgi:hypothetical protein